MASSVKIIRSSCSYEMRRPRLLKDFLSDDSSMPSCSSHNSHFRLLRSRSKSASISISAIHKASEVVVKAMRFFPFASIVKSPSLLPRSISRKKSTRGPGSDKSSVLGDNHQVSRVSTDHQQVTPKIKDILRWKSFRDVVEELSTSWLESDFSAEDLNSFGTYDHENDYIMDQKKKMDQGHFSYDENEQQSPVSVLNDSPFRDDHEESASFSNRTIATMESIFSGRKCMLMQRIAEFETLAKLEPSTDEESSFTKEEKSTTNEEKGANGEVEAKARQLLGHFKGTDCDAEDNIVLFDFFRHELAKITSKNQKEIESSELEMLEMAKSWMDRDYCEGTFDSGLLDNKEACLREMEAGLMKWSINKFHEEKQELGRDLEIQVFNDLFDELWADLVTEQGKY